MSDQQETPSQTGKTPQAVVTHWLKELDASDTHEKDWRTKAEKIIKRYRDERDRIDNAATRYNILFANTEVLFGVMYQKTPTPDVRRRFRDEDALGRVTADILNKALSYCIDSYDFDAVMKACVQDVLLPGRGVARVRYKPTMETVQQPDPANPEQTMDVEQVTYEEAPSEYVEWEFYRISPAKRWEKVRWQAFGELLTRDDLVERFPDVGKDVKLTWCPNEHADKGEGPDNIYRRALVWTIWNKTNKKVYAITDGYKDAPLAVEDDPLHLEGFFPLPRPMYGITTTDSLIPVPEYTQYVDQAMELDLITERRSALIDMLRYRGVRDGAIEELASLANAKDGTFVAVQNLATLTEKGGLERAFQAVPNEDIAAVVTMLFEKQQDLKQSIYEITGISDIARGATDPNETKGAQQLKAQYTNIRIQPRQKEVERFARDLLRIKAEIIAEHFSAQTLQQMTGVQLPTPEQKQLAISQAQQQTPPDQSALQEAQALVTWDDVIRLLRDEKLRSFRIDVETDSTIRADDQADKQAVSEMMTALSGMLRELVPAVQAGAITKDFARSLILFVMRRFKASKDIEEQVEKLFEGEMPPTQQQQQALQQQQEALTQQQTQAKDEAAGHKEELSKAAQGLKDQQNAIALDQTKLDADRMVFEAQKRAAGAEISAQKTELVATAKTTDAKISSAVKARLVKPDDMSDGPTLAEQEQERDQRMADTLGSVMGQFQQGLSALMQQLRAPKRAEAAPDGSIVIHTETVQ